MTGSLWWDLAIGIAAALLLAWLGLVAARCPVAGQLTGRSGSVTRPTGPFTLLTRRGSL